RSNAFRVGPRVQRLIEPSSRHAALAELDVGVRGADCALGAQFDRSALEQLIENLRGASYVALRAIQSSECDERRLGAELGRAPVTRDRTLDVAGRAFPDLGGAREQLTRSRFVAGVARMLAKSLDELGALGVELGPIEELAVLLLGGLRDFVEGI